MFSFSKDVMLILALGEVEMPFFSYHISWNGVISPFLLPRWRMISRPLSKVREKVLHQKYIFYVTLYLQGVYTVVVFLMQKLNVKKIRDL